MILKKGLLTELVKNLNNKIDFLEVNNFFWVGPVLGGYVCTRQAKIF